MCLCLCVSLLQCSLEQKCGLQDCGCSRMGFYAPLTDPGVSWFLLSPGLLWSLQLILSSFILTSTIHLNYFAIQELLRCNGDSELTSSGSRGSIMGASSRRGKRRGEEDNLFSHSLRPAETAPDSMKLLLRLVMWLWCFCSSSGLPNVS